MTDVKPMWATLHDLRTRLDTETAKRLQAEDAQRDAEEVARRAEERATQTGDDRDGWRAFAIALANEHLIDPLTDQLNTTTREFIIETLYEEWARGGTLDGLPIAALVNGAEEELR